jgi:hypothetical protein
MMAMCRSVAERGQVALPLTAAANEIELIKAAVPDKRVILSTPGNAKEYPA